MGKQIWGTWVSSSLDSVITYPCQGPLPRLRARHRTLGCRGELCAGFLLGCPGSKDDCSGVSNAVCCRESGPLLGAAGGVGI